MFLSGSVCIISGARIALGIEQVVINVIRILKQPVMLDSAGDHRHRAKDGADEDQEEETVHADTAGVM